MNHPRPHARLRVNRSGWRVAAISTAVLIACSAQAQDDASDKAELERLRNTTAVLVKAMVDHGLMSREQGEALLRQTPPAPASAAASNATEAPLSQVSAATPATPASAARAGKTVRVPYVSESMRAQIKDEIRNDVMATARSEGWADSRQIPKWVRGTVVEGDVRVVAQHDGLDNHNTPASVYRSQVDSPAWAPDLLNTQTDRRRLTLRARLGVTSKVSDDVSAGIRIVTGSTSGSPTSESQTLGTDFIRHTVGLDRAYIRWEPKQTLNLEAGRMAVPFYGSDLLWPTDLSLDGVALRSELDLASGMFAFATAGAFALEELSVSRADKWLFGVQGGLDWAVTDKTQMRLGVGYYNFKGIEGTRETDPPPSGALAGTTPYQLSQYRSTIRQKGNTLINLNDPTSTAAPVWGLASKFQPINLTAGVTLSQLDPVQVGFTFDYVKNGGFDLADIQRRAGTSTLSDLAEKNTGVQLRAQVGSPKFGPRGSWNAFFAMRKFERDAWVDAFTDTTWHLGGTNHSGYSLGSNYAFDNNTSIGFRWTSTRNLDDKHRFLAVPGDPTSVSGNLSSAPMKIDVLQLELNTRF